MAIHPQFPKSPYEILKPEVRWLPSDELFRESLYDRLLPPLVHKLRKEVYKWREDDYEGASKTSRALLKWWFATEHLLPQSDGNIADFKYYFAQRESLETVIYLHDVIQFKDKHDLMRYDASGNVSGSMFDESWRRLVIKMATGSGKTKVMSLLIVWSYFHRKYERDSDLSSNFLVIAPNIIVLDRIKNDFEGLKIFNEDPLIPENGFEGQNWQDDFEVKLHLQDDVRVINKFGNIFLTNIHRVYLNDEITPSFDDDDTTDYFLGKKPKGKTNDSKTDLGLIVRDIDELMVINDEAHHVHDPRLAWFKSIQDIHNKLLMKDKFLSMQIDVTATPKHNNGGIFVQTISDYPLVEAIHQNIVKHPVLPDEASIGKLHEVQSSIFSEKYADYINLGVEEWSKAYQEYKKLGKKALLFVMTDDTKNCDDVAEYLERTFPELKNAVLVIHTNNNGDIKEDAKGKSDDELKELREQANKIDSFDSKYKAVVSVLMLKEGWDVKNVTTIVGLRAYSAKSNILPEQTLGRGLRRMFPRTDIIEQVSVVGTPAFMEFVQSIKNEGVELERAAMGSGTQAKSPVVVEVEEDNPKKNMEELDIEIPILTPRIYREYKNFSEIDISQFTNPVTEKTFSEAEQREIVFKDIATDEISHTTMLKAVNSPDSNSMIAFFVNNIKKDLRLIGGQEILHGKVKDFMQNYLFGKKVVLDNLNIMRNLSEPEISKTVYNFFKMQINALTIKDKGEAVIDGNIKLRKTRPFSANQQAFYQPKKSVFNKIIGDSHFELEFASFLDGCNDIVSFAKNYFGVNFKLDYINKSGDISNYYPDFIVKKNDKEIYIVETKGIEDLDVPLKTARLKEWCKDINKLQNKVKYDFVFVEYGEFQAIKFISFEQVVSYFTKYKE